MEWIREKFSEFHERPAIVENGQAFSYADLIEKIDALSEDLPSEPQSLVTIDDSSTFEGIARLIALSGSPHIALPSPTILPGAEREQMHAIAQKSPLYSQLDGSGLVLFSSGTSGQPKGMLHRLDALLNRYKAVRPRNDRCLLLLLIDHIGGLDTAFRCLFAGSTLIVPAERTADCVAATIESERANILPASPTFLNLLLISGAIDRHDLTSLKIIAYGAEPMPGSLLKRLNAQLPQVDLQQKFGTSETGAIRIESQGKDSLFFRIKDSDTEWKIVDNELWLKTPSRIVGYLNKEAENLEADGWYATGDLVESDEDEQIRIIGRITSMINVGGQKVHPSEVEAILSEIPEIDDAHVFGVEDPITGRSISCRIATQDTRSTLDWKRTIRKHCRGKLSPWKIPSSIEVVEHFEANQRLKRQ